MGFDPKSASLDSPLIFSCTSQLNILYIFIYNHIQQGQSYQEISHVHSELPFEGGVILMPTLHFKTHNWAMKLTGLQTRAHAVVLKTAV